MMTDYQIEQALEELKQEIYEDQDAEALAYANALAEETWEDYHSDF